MVLDKLKPTAGMKCIRHILLAFNAIFIFTGVILISVGGPANDIYIDYAKFMDGTFLTFPILVIGIGCLVFCVALFGCYGAYKLSVAAIMVFCVMLATIFLLEVIIGLAVYMMQDQIGNMLVRTFNQTMSEYKNDQVSANAIDSVQYQFYCCGIQGFEDWSTWVNPKDFDHRKFVEVQTYDNIVVAVPPSCCASLTYDENNYRYCSSLKALGCLPRFKFLIDQCSLLLSSTIFMIALMQLLGVIFAYKLAHELRKQKTLRDRLKWEVKENIICGATILTKEKVAESEYARLPSYSP